MQLITNNCFCLRDFVTIVVFVSGVLLGSDDGNITNGIMWQNLKKKFPHRPNKKFHELHQKIIPGCHHKSPPHNFYN